MILAMIVLWSLCMIYFTRLLNKKRMKAAAVSVLVLFVYIIVWVYLTLIVDIIDIGLIDFNSREAFLHGSLVYNSLVELTCAMSVISLPMLEAIVLVAVIVLFAGICVVFHGALEITKAIIRFSHSDKYSDKNRSFNKVFFPELPYVPVKILKLNCRLNC